jgi:hypothetical protein
MSPQGRPSWWRSSPPPDDWDDAAGVIAGRITLPLHLCWSGPTSSFYLNDPVQLRYVYATVLREGTANDVREWLNPTVLVRIWDDLWLPQAVHEVWDSWIAERRERVAV